MFCDCLPIAYDFGDTCRDTGLPRETAHTHQVYHETCKALPRLPAVSPGGQQPKAAPTAQVAVGSEDRSKCPDMSGCFTEGKVGDTGLEPVTPAV